MYKDDVVHKNCYHNLTLRLVYESFRIPNNCVSAVKPFLAGKLCKGQKLRLVQKSAPGLLRPKVTLHCVYNIYLFWVFMRNIRNTV